MSGYKLIKRTGSPCWQIYWSEKRRPFRRSTGEIDRAKAEIVLANFVIEQTLPAKRLPDEMLIAHLLDDFQAEVADKQPSKITVQYNIKALMPFWGDLLVSAITSQKVQEYIAQRPVSSETHRRELAVLKAAISHARKENRLTDAPHIRLPSPSPSRDRWLTQKEIDLLLKHCRTTHMRLFILLALNTGQRKRAILDLQWFQVDFTNGIIHFNPPGRKQTSKKRVSVPMNDTLRKTLKLARTDAKSTWVVHHNGKQVIDVKKAFKRLCDDLGFKDVSPHTLRHTAGTRMAQGGVDMWKISGMLGHSHSRTTELYLKHNPEYLRDTVDKLDTGKQMANKTRKRPQKRSKSRKQ